MIKNTKYIVSYYFAILILFSGLTFAQDTNDVELFAIHPKIGLNGNFYSADFSHFQGSVDCGLFNSGSGWSASYSIFAERLIQPKTYFSLGLGLSDKSGIFTLETSLPAREINSFDLSKVVTNNEIDANIMYFEIKPEMKYIVLDEVINGPLRIGAGLNFLFSTKASFTQKDIIKSPDNAVFVSNNKQERDIVSGDIKTINNFLFGLNFSLENLLKVSPKAYLSQQISFEYFLGDVISDSKWKMFSLKLELGLRYSIYNPQPEEIKPEPEKTPIKPVVVENKKVQVPSISIKILEPEKNLKQLTGNEILATKPFVSAVFFDKDSSRISDTYFQTPTPLPSFYEGDPVEQRKYVLPRIAEIVKNNPKASILLIGATSGSQNEPEGIELAKRRAQSVYDAFKSLGVSEDKLSITAHLMPENATNQEIVEGVQENQRVEIIIKNAAVQEYVGIQKFAEISGKVRIKVDFKNIVKSNSVILSPSFYDTLIVCTIPGIYEVPIYKRLDSNQKSVELQAELSVKELEQKAKVNVSLSSIPREQTEKSLTNFEAILLFEFDSGKLSENNKSLLGQMSEILPQGATIVIYGSADFIGSERRNIQLASQRAKATEQIIEDYSPDKFKIITTNRVKKFSEDTPEGRFFNRSIRIRAK